MAHTTKITTCCYCSSRTMMRLTGKKQHRLVCGACGAPIQKMHPIPLARVAPAPEPKRKARPTKVSRPKPKKRKSTLRYILSEIWDEVEDIFD